MVGKKTQELDKISSSIQYLQLIQLEKMDKFPSIFITAGIINTTTFP